MKRSALKAGEVYAWNTSTGRYAKAVTVVDADKLYERQTPRFGKRGGPIEPTTRTTATRGTEYPYVEVGVLVRHESGQEVLVNPAHLRAPWDEWQAQQAILDQRANESAWRRQQEENEREATRLRLHKLLLASPYADRLKAGTRHTTVDNDLLIEILERMDALDNEANELASRA